MSDTKFTPGPWHWNRDEWHDGYTGLFDKNDNPVLYPQRCNEGDDGDAWFGIDEDYYGEDALKLSDANLIAAAPEMDAMLEKITNEAGYFEYRTGKTVTWREEADKILAKARGE